MVSQVSHIKGVQDNRRRKKEEETIKEQVAIIKNNRVFAIVPGTNEDDENGCDHQHIRFMKHTSKSIGSGVAKSQTIGGGDSIHHHTSLKRHH